MLTEQCQRRCLKATSMLRLECRLCGIFDVHRPIKRHCMVDEYKRRAPLLPSLNLMQQLFRRHRLHQSTIVYNTRSKNRSKVVLTVLFYYCNILFPVHISLRLANPICNELPHPIFSSSRTTNLAANAGSRSALTTWAATPLGLPATR
jgi:hypothetical protein